MPRLRPVEPPAQPAAVPYLPSFPRRDHMYGLHGFVAWRDHFSRVVGSFVTRSLSPLYRRAHGLVFATATLFRMSALHFYVLYLMAAEEIPCFDVEVPAQVRHVFQLITTSSLSLYPRLWEGSWTSGVRIETRTRDLSLAERRRRFYVFITILSRLFRSRVNRFWFEAMDQEGTLDLSLTYRFSVAVKIMADGHKCLVNAPPWCLVYDLILFATKGTRSLYDRAYIHVPGENRRQIVKPFTQLSALPYAHPLLRLEFE